MANTPDSKLWHPFWGNAAQVASEDLTDWLYQYNWDYTLNVEHPRPTADDWMRRFAQGIDSVDLFPCRRRYTSEPPGWMPIRFRDRRRIDCLTILVALPRGALHQSLRAFDVVRPVLEQAANNVLISAKINVRFATRLKIEGMLERLDRSTVEFVTGFVRDHHQLCATRCSGISIVTSPESKVTQSECPLSQT